MARKGVDCGCGAREDILDRLAALRQRVEVLETEINQIESEFPEVLRDVRSAEASAVSAAESAESSREIVEGYDDRLGAVEQGVIDVNDYAEAIGDDVSAIDTEIHTTRPYMTTNTEQSITAKKHIPTATANDSSDVWVNKAFVQSTDGRNNLVHNIGDETITGVKTFTSAPNTRGISEVPDTTTFRDIIRLRGSNNFLGVILSVVYNTNGTTSLYVQLRNSNGTIKNVVLASGDVI